VPALPSSILDPCGSRSPRCSRSSGPPPGRLPPPPASPTGSSSTRASSCWCSGATTAGSPTTPVRRPPLDAIGAVGPFPAQPVVHLDAGYDYRPCRQALANRGMAGQIATRRLPAAIQAGRRWVIERTHAWATRTASCASVPSGADWWWRSGWRWPAPPSSAAGCSPAPGPATAGRTASPPPMTPTGAGPYPANL
jgi:hypothetical protein